MNKNKKSTVKLYRYKKRANRSAKLPVKQTRKQLRMRASTRRQQRAGSAKKAADRTLAVKTWEQEREKYGIENGKSFLSHLPIPADNSSSEFHLHIPTSNKDLITQMAHELLSHQIKGQISKTAFSGDDSVINKHADIIATKILNHKFAQKNIDKLSDKMTNFENVIASQARHELIGAIPIPEVGEVINLALDGVVDTFKSGDTALGVVKLGKTLHDIMNNIPDVVGGAKSSRKFYRRGIPLRDARRHAKLLRRGGARAKKITKKNKTRNKK